ncbi:helix-turn-helix domain-containing protein [Aquamicrobium sp. LC103]|uniref:helix-turn-helix domain-containing protein n=1 Tax=Aquamicrobium sp. LC103 TaxID=1120658 RepID=UPI00063E6FD9|nr:helix-turn-helix domain-containing protein [Aquamicrobium sp. LC103]TKT69102.1 helix-turn-helix domain-containing protein [Aquamicrobium sp. LC103]
MQQQPEDDTTLNLIWGAERIAAFINRSPQQTYHMLSKGLIPGRRIGERWVVDRRDLVAFFRQNM